MVFGLILDLKVCLDQGHKSTDTGSCIVPQVLGPRPIRPRVQPHTVSTLRREILSFVGLGKSLIKEKESKFKKKKKKKN